MSRKHFPIVVLLLLSFSSTAPAQSWSGILDSSRAVNWSQAGIPGGIPNRTTICTTLNSGASAAQINSAIQSCPSGQVVSLSAGTYNLSSGITFDNKSGVTLRGAGANKTILMFTNSTPCGGWQADICIMNGETSAPDVVVHNASWTGGYSRGSTTITLSNTTGLQVGNILMLDQVNDGADNGSVFICSAQGSSTGQCSDEGASAGQRPGRDQIQIVRVTAVSGNQVSFTPGLYMPNWRSSQSPGAWWGNTTIHDSGIEDLTADHTNSGAALGIGLFDSYRCWVKGVRSVNSNRAHVRCGTSAACVVQNSYFYGTKNAASQSYGFESFPSSDAVFENNITQKVTTPIQLNAASSGTVISYNYSINDYYNVSPGWLQPSFQQHAGGLDNVLVEGNIGSGYEGDAIHGTHHFLTAFRNYFSGWEQGKNSNTPVVHLWAYTRFQNIIGNVLGRAGYHTAYECAVPNSCNDDVSIYSLGSASNNTRSDTSVKSTLMRWGNYDVVNNASRFLASEVPTSLSQFSNAVPATNNLPASFYRTSKPDFWGSMPWPAIGPDVSGGSGPGGHAYNNPAADCYFNTMGGPIDGSGGALPFNADSCFGTGGGSGTTSPTPPSGLTAVPK